MKKRTKKCALYILPYNILISPCIGGILHALSDISCSSSECSKQSVFSPVHFLSGIDISPSHPDIYCSICSVTNCTVFPSDLRIFPQNIIAIILTAPGHRTTICILCLSFNIILISIEYRRNSIPHKEIKICQPQPSPVSHTISKKSGNITCVSRKFICTRLTCSGYLIIILCICASNSDTVIVLVAKKSLHR